MPLVLPRRLQPLRGLVDLVPAITVILLLLSFFLLSSSFVLQPGIKVDPPRSVASVGTPASRLIVVVTMPPQQLDATGKPLPRDPILYFNDQVIRLDELRSALDKIPSSRIPPSLVLKMDKDVPVSVFTNIIDIAHTTRFPIILATKPGEATP